MTKTVLITESVSDSKFVVKNNLKDFVVPEGMMLVEGIVGAVETYNRNNRFYSKVEYSRHVEDFNQRIEKSGGILGEMEHPQSMNICLPNVSHKMLNIWIDEDNMVRGNLLLLDTPNGMIAQSIVRSGTPLPISSRATGNVDAKGITTLERLETYDLVGTAGFEQTALYEKKFKNESNESGNSKLITESFIFNLDNSGRIVHESKNLQTQKINENMKDKDKVYITLDEAKELIRLAVSEEKEKQEVTIQKMDERFETLYANAIESWIKDNYTPHLMTNVQEWLTETYAPIIEKWITESVMPKNAELTERWITEQYTPKLSEGVQNWLTESYSPIVEKWITESVLPKNAEVTQEWLAETYAQLIQDWIVESYSPEIQNFFEAKMTKTEDVANDQNDAAQKVEGCATDKVEEKEEKEEKEVAKTNESVKFNSRVLDTLDGLINESLDIHKPKVAEASIDSSQYKFAPSWLRLIPENHKPKWEALTLEQQNKVYSRASVRVLETMNDVHTFWESLNYESLTENKIETINRNITLTENLAGNPRASLISFSKQLK